MELKIYVGSAGTDVSNGYSRAPDLTHRGSGESAPVCGVEASFVAG